MKPIVRFASRHRISLSLLQEWLALAYFQEARDNAGLKVADAALRMGISVPTAARLARRLREEFIAEEAQHDLPTRISLALWSRPLGRARLHQILSDVKASRIDQVLDQLVLDKRVAELPGRTTKYRFLHTEERLVSGEWAPRVRALDSLLSNLASVVQKRLFEEDKRSFARTLSFDLAAPFFAELDKFYRETIFPTLARLEQESKQSQEPLVPTQVTMFWAPLDTGADDSEEGEE